MEGFKGKAIQTSKVKPKILFTCVDGAFIKWQHREK